MKKLLTYVDPYTIGLLSILSIIFVNAGYFIWDYNILIPFLVTVVQVFIVPYIVLYGIRMGGMLIADYEELRYADYVGEDDGKVRYVDPLYLPIRVDAVKSPYNRANSTIFKVTNGVRVYIDKAGRVRHTFGIGFLVTWVTGSGELNHSQLIKLNYKPFFDLLKAE